MAPCRSRSGSVHSRAPCFGSLPIFEGWSGGRIDRPGLVFDLALVMRSSRPRCADSPFRQADAEISATSVFLPRIPALDAEVGAMKHHESLQGQESEPEERRHRPVVGV